MESLFGKVDQYIERLVAEDNDALIYAKERILKSGIDDASISSVQGKLLQVFAKSCNAIRILELGTLGAYSTIWLANALPEEGKVITIESDEHHAEVALQNIYNANLQHKIELKKGKAIDIMKEMIQAETAPFDMFFIDADKAPYKEYFQLALKLSRKGSIIICDNVIRNGKVLDENSDDEKVIGVQRLNTFIKDCKEVTATILQTVGKKEYDGMLIAVVS